ncbi:MAG: hypothetical protein IJ538_02920 [Clostridia bacterium]|nr:hypothetical protein [Clostridia bacterium]
MLINNKEFIPFRFNSGEMRIMHSKLDKFIKNNEVSICFNNDMSIFDLFLIVEYYRDRGVEVNLTITYLPYQRMDHPDKDEIETLKLVAKLFNNLKLKSLKICEPHSSIAYFNNATKISFVELIFKSVCEKINFDVEKDVIVFTDKGSTQRYFNLAKNCVYGEKRRDEKTGLVKKLKLVGKIKPGQKIMIIDDIISSGDTILSTLDQIELQTKEKVYILTGHFEKNRRNGRLIKDPRVKKIFSTNSLTKKRKTKLFLYDAEKLAK